MNQDNRQIDFRMYRPAAVLVIDLVKHSTQPKAVVQSIQRVMEEVLSKARESLKIEEAYFNYTGDGYVCAFVGDSSPRVMDFINSAVPELKRRFEQHRQELRAGLDFGLVHLARNMLTGGVEHFDAPGIQAARLESAARPGEVLCTETVQKLFAPHYPHMFSAGSRLVRAKDGKRRAFTVLPFDTVRIQRVFSDYLFRVAKGDGRPPDQRRKILIVDDDPITLKLMGWYFDGGACETYEKVMALDAASALESFRPGEFALVVTDMMMPGLTGIELFERITRIDPSVVGIMITGYGGEEYAKRFLAAGGFYFMTKPFHEEEFEEVVGLALTSQLPRELRNNLEILCDDLGALLWLMQQLSESLRFISRQMSSVQDTAHSLLRHKAKHVVLDLVEGVQPGCDILERLATAQVQLASITRLSKILGRVKVGEIESYLDGYIGDLQRLHPGVEFTLSHRQGGEDIAATPFGTAIILIVCELIDNAISAVGRAGRVETALTVLRSADLLQIVVRDSGPGIPEEIVGRVYEAGVTTKGHGRGLGLCLVREAVQLLRGEINYEYKDGAAFSVVLPLH